MQMILTHLGELARVLDRHGAHRVFLVCDSSFDKLDIRDDILRVVSPVARFSAFTPNPRYEEAAAGAARFLESGADAILAVGGGSAMDVAKCVKAFSAMDPARSYLEQPYPRRGVPLVAIPTTAGTGSESTRFAVIYFRGVKQSLADETLLPDCAILDGRAVMTLPAYQKKCTMMDAVCHAVEAWWSVRSTSESQAHSRTALSLIRKHETDYLAGHKNGLDGMLMAANLAGRAIDIAQTTAAHAMSYKLTSLYGIPHGRAAALCLPGVWEHLLAAADEALAETLDDIARSLGALDARDATRVLRDMLVRLDLSEPPPATEEEIALLVASVNPVRLKNSPIPMSKEAVEAIYRKLLIGA